jgi:hypothetical protein
MAIRRPDTPLAATVFASARMQQEPKTRQEIILAAKKKQEEALAIKRAEAAKRRAKSDSIQKVRVEQFAQRAKDRGMTVKEYSKKIAKQNKGGDQPTSTPDYRQRSAINPCPGGRCRR